MMIRPGLLYCNNLPNFFNYRKAGHFGVGMSPIEEARTLLKQFPSIDQQGIASLLGISTKELRHSIGHDKNTMYTPKSKYQF